MEMNLNSRRLVGFSNEDEKNPLIDRIFDKGIGGKFNEFSAQKTKGAAVKSFLTNFDDIDTLHSDPKYITNLRSGVDTGKNTQALKQPHSKKTHNKIAQPELFTEKVNLLAKNFDTKTKEPILNSINHEEGEKSIKNIQDLESITGFKTMNQLPPSRGLRYNSVNPMERLRIVKKDEKIDTVTKFAKIEKALDPKLSRPTTTIVALNKIDTAYIQKATISQLDKNIVESENKFRKEDTNKAEEDKLMASVNFAEKEIKVKSDNYGYDEDQYMDKINKFIKEAFEGKDYRINFVYYLPSGKENFYELKPTTFENINKEKVYYTLSAKGLTVYIDKKPREFIKLSEWIIERQGYNYVADISFFKNFKIWRILKIWRKNIFKQKKIAYQNELANTLLFNNKDYNQRICYHKEKCNLIIKEKILDLRVGLESISFDDFRRKQLEARRKLRMILNEIHKKCEENFVFGIKAIFSEVQRKINIQNNEANYNDDDTIKKKKRMAASSGPTSDKASNASQAPKEEQLLSDDNIVGFENYPYKFKMMIKNECLNFIKLAFLFDYIMLDVLRRTYIFSMNDTLKRLEDFNFVEPPVNLRENVLNKRDEYVKPSVNSQNRVIPYFLVKCLLDEKPIENRDRIKLKVKPFFVRATQDDDFDPTAHLQKDYEEQELLALAGEKREEEATSQDSTKIDRDSEITIEIIERPHHYFIRYDPDLETLIHSFIKQVDDGFNELKVPRWRAHKEFSKYLHYLENWDDRYADWTSGDDSEELHPQEILSLSEDPLFLEKNDLLEAALKIAYKKCDSYLQKLNPYLQLHWKQMKINKNLLLIESLKDADEMMRLLFYYTEKNIKTLQRWIPYEEELGMVKLTLETTLRKEIIENQSNVINFLKPLMPNILRERAHRIERWISEMSRSIQGSIDNEKQYLDKTKSKETLDQWFYFYERKLNTCDTIVSLLRNKNFEISQDDAKNIEVINSMKYTLKVAWDELNDNLTRNKDKLKINMLNVSIPGLLKETKHIDDLLKEDDKFITYDRITGRSLIPSYITELESYENMFKGIERNKNTYNDLLKVLGESDFNFDQVISVHENLKILKNLWNALKDFDEECDEWKKTKFSEIDTDKIIKRIDEYYTHGKKAELQFGDNGSAIKELLTNVNNFRESMQVINDLNSPFLKSHHWERIQNLFPDISQRLEHKDYPLDDLLQIKAYEHQKVINDIALEAKNHDELKSKMAEITRMKNAIMFTVVVENDAYKTFQKLEEVVEKIEECQSKLNNVLASRYVRLLKSETAGKGDDPYTIKSDLDGSLELIEDIKAFQSKWRYLNNILNAPGSSGSDIRKKIPDNNFDKIDNEWKNIMNKLNDPPSVLLFYGKMRRGQENFFQKNLYQLEQIQLKIEQYLTSMRGLFERFFFISNDDLLYMLSNSSAEKINEIKPYLMKIFEDISDLLIPKSESSNVTAKEITAVISASKEELYFEKNFEKKTVKLSEKLEEWLRNLEVMIVSTLKEKMNYGFVAFADITKDPLGHESWLEKISVSKENKDNVNMVTENISQVIATVTHVMFCDNTEAAITMQRVESTSITQWYKKIETAIKTYARMVNKDFASKNMRRIISNLITHHVHYLEICRNLCVEEPYNTDDFIWQQQLRGYILPSEVEKTPVVRIKQLKSDMEYGYEYIGPSSRVVITPLTDRVWLTMTSALHIKLGCSLGGPAGTGKTETTKDLAKFFGIQCIVFNCSEQIDYKILGNIFSGLCAHKQGAYACLDEFNRINVEVLSVVATQLFVITQSLLAMVPGEPPKQIQILPPSMVELVGKLGVFITMNPTYSGRTELPDNLKSSFRPITMMVPDFLTISEVRLYSEGFTESKALAKKITKLYALASQQLSQQDHYDFTLRTVGTVLSIAGNLKRQFKPSGSGRERKDEELILLNALRDANFPKFVAEDVHLFRALLTDLFPETELTEPTLEVFESEVKAIIKENNFYNSSFSIKKSLQLFDIINIRLGVCLTGGAGSGKSTCISLVEKAMTNLRLKGDPDPRYKEVVKSTINPKSITMGELYGQENEDTKTFVFGICTIKIKEALALDQDSEGNRYGWVVLDGPIDTMWVENMNSVLDDSMTLCLSNGERIKLKPHVKIIFEVEDLSRASLATVSRLGIVYFGANELGWRPYFYSWMKRIFHDESIFSHEMKNFLIQIFEDKVDESIENIDDLFASGCIFIKPVAVQCVKSLCNFLEILYTRENGFIGKETPNLDNQDNMSRIKKKIVSVFAFSMIWGVFGGVNNKGYHKIESYVRNKFVEIKMENSQLIMEHYFDFHKNDFVKYSTEGNPFNYVKDMPFFSIFVPTIDTLRYSYIFELLIRQQKNVFVTGETGVGKTAILLNVLNKLLATEEFTHIQMNFSAQTSSEDTQKSLESKLEPKQGKKILGAKGGKKLTIFIDDINMPEPNDWGAHPPIELLRQYVDQGGFYDRPKFFWKRIEDACLFVCGGPPIGGRSKLTDRFGRHFNIISLPQPSRTVLISIFENILKGFLNNFNEYVKNTYVEVTLGSIELFEFVSDQMKPIPAKFHYTFNLRDVSKVFQGILMTESRYINTKDTFIKLWAHESLRVFGDRLINETDLKALQMNIVNIIRTKYKLQTWTYETLFKQNPLYFGEIHKGDSQDRPYEEIVNIPSLLKRLEYFLEMNNKNNKKNAMQLVFFDYAVMHILRITRVLRQPRGNMILIGHGGNGKQTLTKFSAFTMYCQVVSIQQKQYRVDLREIIKQAGSMRKKTVLLLTDNSITSNSILEDINNILNIGEIPNLYQTSDELQAVLNNLSEYMKSKSIPETREKYYETFVEMTRENLHIVFCTSPVGEALRLRFRKFPALINCCTLNWFINWPQEALISCCKRVFQQKLTYPDTVKDTLVTLSTTAHSNVEELTERYFTELSRRVYVTPKSFLDMIDLFIKLVSTKKDEIDKIVVKFDDGVKKLEKTHTNIQNLEKELTILEPEIAQKKIENEAAFSRVKAEHEKLDIKTAELREKSNQVAVVHSNLKKVAARMDYEKSEIMKKLTDTWDEVKENLTKKAIQELLNIKAFGEKRKVIIEAAVFLLKGKKFSAIDELIKTLSSEKERILGMQQEIEDDKVSENVMKQFSQYYNIHIPKTFECPLGADENTVDQIVESAMSEPIKTLYKWGRGCIYCFEQIKKNLIPLKEQRAVIDKEKIEKEQELDTLNEDYKINNERIQKLQAEQGEIQRKLNELSEKKKITTRRKNNAGLLIGLLQEEGERWKENLVKLKVDMENFLGNMFLSTVSISYLSPYTGTYRRQQIDQWIHLCQSHEIKVAKDFGLDTTLSDQVSIRNWNISGLPSDAVSVQNGIMLFNNPKFALLIDPQLQANQWLKKLFRNKISIFKGDTKDENMKKSIETLTVDIIKGNTVLVENISEEIDGLYNPILSRTSGGEGSEIIEINNNKIEFNPNFKIFFTTKLANPHYPPEFYIKLNIINFTVTFQGLTEQLLSEVFKGERRDKYEQRDGIIESMGRFNQELVTFSRNILQKLSDANEELILDDEDLIQTLQNAKSVSDVVKQKMEDNAYIETEINIIRDEYIPVAIRGSILYFVIVDLGSIDPMYQFSLEYFKKIFSQSIKKAKQSDNIKERVLILEKTITEDIYKNIKRGIFESHKTIFSFLISIYIKRTAKIIEDDEWNLFLKGPTAFDKTDLPENPEKNYFSDFAWDTLLFTQNRYKMNNFCNSVISNLADFKKFFDNIQELSEFVTNFPNGIETYPYSQLIVENNFLKLILMKIFRPDKVLLFIKKFIQVELGDFFIDTSPSRLEEIYEESDEKTPIIFILSQGADPTRQFLEFQSRFTVETEEGSKQPIRYTNISLGQGQEGEARKAILDDGIKNGTWVLLQNCHLFVTFMPELANIVQNLQQDESEEGIHPNFRLWLTSMPNVNFPVSILQNSLKMTTEPPSGVKANIKKIYDEMNDNKLNLCPKHPDKLPKIMFTLSMFHSVLQERKKFGPIGFNLRYDFNQADFDTSVKLLSIYLEEADDVPWSSIIYLVGEVNYGGRVTDDFDRITMMATLNKFLSDKILEREKDENGEEIENGKFLDYKFSKSGRYFSPHFENLGEYREYIDTLPIFDEPDLFGLHENANIIYQLQESNKIQNLLLSVIPKTTQAGKSTNEIVLEIVNELLIKKPEPIDKREQRHKSHDKVYENGLPHSLTIVLYQEIEKFNKLINKILSSLDNLKNAIEGLVIMSSETDEIYNSLMLNKIPIAWAKICYPSHKPLSSWFNDLLARVEFMRNWLMGGHPSSFWISGLFFPQGFITGVLQNHAREFKIPVSDITFKHSILEKAPEDINKGPQIGVYIYGLYLEAATWDIQTGTLVDQKPGEMSYKMPVIHLETTRDEKKPDGEEEEDDENENKVYYYSCPVFKTLKRTGIISASGRSDNYDMPSKESKEFWITRGTALICQLDD